MDDADRERKFKAGAKVEVTRFKGLGEMPPSQLRERARTNELVESLMGRRAELRFQFTQERARTIEDLDVQFERLWRNQLARSDVIGRTAASALH